MLLLLWRTLTDTPESRGRGERRRYKGAGPWGALSPTPALPARPLLQSSAGTQGWFMSQQVQAARPGRHCTRVLPGLKRVPPRAWEGREGEAEHARGPRGEAEPVALGKVSEIIAITCY